MREYIISVDIAKKRDYTAIQVYRDTPELITGDARANSADKTFHFQDLVYQDKMQDIKYQDLARYLDEFVNTNVSIANNYELLVDGTGVGVAVVDILRDYGLYPIPIVATSGGEAKPIYTDINKIFGCGQPLQGMRTISEWHVPKNDMVHAGQIAMERGLIRPAPDVDFIDDFAEQLKNFKGRFNDKTNYTRYNAEDDDIHDDFITCYLMAMWWVSNRTIEATLPINDIKTQDKVTWDVLGA